VPADIEIRMTSLEDKARAARNFSYLVSESNVSGDLKLDDMELTSIPSEIWKMGQVIKSISMQRNQISIVPEAFFDLISIQRLCLDHNLIKRFPDELGNISYLQYISADFNMIQCLPHSVGMLTNLKVLRLAENCISALPLELGGCEKITTLDITGNPTTFPPREVCTRGSLAICKFLKTFSSATSSGILRFKSIPMEILPIEVMQIPRLKRIDLLGSNVKIIPVFCAGLSTSLQKIDVIPEQLVFPHPSIMATGTEATLKYLQNILDGIDKSQVRSSGTYGVINLVGMFLPEVPPQVLSATALTKLDISQNAIHEFTGLHESIYLKHFIAEQNQFRVIPHDVLRSTKVLVTINMNRNILTQFPQSVLLCPLLKTLCIGGNE
jgi:leucine-rich repeat protein SHOC2